jgi:hypothetical protein
MIDKKLDLGLKLVWGFGGYVAATVFKKIAK